MKRALDLVVAASASFVLFPVIVVVLLATYLMDRGSPIYTSQRVGKGGRLFWMLKVRTMVIKADETGVNSTADDDPRITALGRIIRRFKLDEVPQLYNILRGDMSIIGPRPPLPAQVETYTDEQREVFEMRPGVLSLAAVEGRRSLTPERRLELHVEYVRSWSLALDFQILWRSLFVVLGRQDAVDALVDGNS